ncbi:MAG: hypothetical protein EXR48_04860 [Dehalococcoidia bacterium]|nr:hypothetical protein [Dehalococcoidia bacterium]
MLTFERGDGARPKGHALLYVRDAGDSGKLLATYVIVLPVAVDLVKYMPPFLASQAAELAGRGISAFAFPPVPEPVESVERLRQLAQLRDEDLLFGGAADSKQFQRLLELVNDRVQEYAEAYHAYEVTLPSLKPASASSPALAEKGQFDVNEVLQQLMSDRDRLAEMTKLIGKLRFALGGTDRNLLQETVAKLQSLAKLLPPNWRGDSLIKAALDASQAGAVVAQLYLDRCYKLLADDAPGVRELDERIRATQGSPP